MKLLFDQNISPRLVPALSDIYPGSAHVQDFNLHQSDDEKVWLFAKEQGFTIVSKDSDFHQRSFVFGCPPKVVWIQRGNCSTAVIERILRAQIAPLTAFHEDGESAFLALV